MKLRRTIAVVGLCIQSYASTPFSRAPHVVQGTVVDSNARFTVITPTLVRLEFSSNGNFIDQRFYFAWHRNIIPPQFKVCRTSGTLTITTSRLKLVWKEGGDEVNPGDLSIQFLNDDSSWKTWHPGDEQTANLGGTLTRLDGSNGAQPLPDGVISRDGWFLYRDNTFLVSNSTHPWMQTRPASENADWYFFGYGIGHYHVALEDLTTISGRIPIPPRFMFGAWSSRYYSYTASEFKQLVREYGAHQFPLDVMVMDMGWHTTPHWGSMDWNSSLIPQPGELLTWLHQHNLHVSLNWHPNDGIGPWYSKYDQFCRAMGIDPAKKQMIPFEDTNEKFMSNYYKLLMDPIEKLGVDVWWLDGGSHLGWDNALDFWNIGRPSTGRRGASFSRWGGWGDQRYPISFSGDTSSLWRELRFEVPFTSTGGNVGADYWSHDIGGHRLKIPNSQLFTRWLQFGALSPIFRTHGSSDFGNFRIPWYYGAQAETAARRAYDLRAQLLPYIYTSAYLTWKTSLPLARPLYLDYPDATQSYDHPEEYQFGPDLLVSPIVNRGIGKAWLSAADVWFPGGTWWNLLTDESVSQSGDHPILAVASEIPVFVRGGVPLPMQPITLRMTVKPADPLIVRVYPGPSGQFTLYQDDGTSSAYLHGSYSLTPLQYRNLNGNGIQVIAGSTHGNYTGQPQLRRLIIQLPITTHPSLVVVDGKSIPKSSTTVPGYSYNPTTVTTEVRLAATSIRKQLTISVHFRGSQQEQALLPQIVNRIVMTRRALAGAGQMQTTWKFQLDHLIFHLQTLLAEASQVQPTSLSSIQAQWQADDHELAQVQTAIELYKKEQAQAAAFALSNAYLSASVKLRKEAAGLTTNDVPRDFKPFGAPNDISGYSTGLLLHVSRPSTAIGDTLAVHIPGLAEQKFQLPPEKTSVFAFFPFMQATRYPLYHFRGTAMLTVRSMDGSRRSLSRDIDVQHELLNLWNLVGPFAPDQVPALEDSSITAATLHRTYTGKDGKTISWQTWRTATADQDYAKSADYLGARKQWIDLYTIYPEDHASAFAVSWVQAPKPLAVSMSVRHNAGIAVWLNRYAVLASPEAKGVTDLSDPPPDIVKLQLEKGWNQILVKTSNVVNDWGFSVRLHLPSDVVCAQSDEPPANNGPKK